MNFGPIDLKHCPFCGSQGMVAGGGSSSQGKLPFYVKCSSLLCLATSAQFTSANDAMDRWNLRSGPKVLVPKEPPKIYQKGYHHLFERAKWDPEALEEYETSIALSAEDSVMYAACDLKGPFKLGEHTIALDAKQSYWYARFVLNGRFELGEPKMMSDQVYAEKYTKFVWGLGTES